ncbi:uncharacterized protein H6S33_002259 [Morchella sextelata]|uniref:uncharacterized protein n=1 Tax=Morchella sextelata TaxID=1174677 RepID=UPI001D055984|nr:uncharacterized protein H6S33_002259 [Morchella sextelata]KAH0608207.1 hypothetical protein H6S33_002259 [Morchella sextelata]
MCVSHWLSNPTHRLGLRWGNTYLPGLESCDITRLAIAIYTSQGARHDGNLGKYILGRHFLGEKSRGPGFGTDPRDRELRCIRKIEPEGDAPGLWWEGASSSLTRQENFALSSKSVRLYCEYRDRQQAPME